MLLLVVGLTFAHRHYTLPYVYLDREIFERHPKRFTWFPFVAFIGVSSEPGSLEYERTARRRRGRLCGGDLERLARLHAEVRAFATLRGQEREAPCSYPGWVDRLLLFCWLPLYLVWLGPSYRDQLERKLSDGAHVGAASRRYPVGAQIRASRSCCGLRLPGPRVFLYREWRSTGLRNLLDSRWLVVRARSPRRFSSSTRARLHGLRLQPRGRVHGVRFGLISETLREALPHAPSLGRVTPTPVAGLRRVHPRYHAALPSREILRLSDFSGRGEPQRSWERPSSAGRSTGACFNRSCTSTTTASSGR